MANLNIIIKKSAVTGTLRSLASEEKDVTYLKVPNVDASAAITELESIGTEFSMYSGTVTDTTGSQSDIRLPKEAIKQ